MYFNDYNKWDDSFSPAPLVPAQEPEVKPKKTRRGLKITALCLACALVGGAAYFLITGASIG